MAGRFKQRTRRGKKQRRVFKPKVVKKQAVKAALKHSVIVKRHAMSGIDRMMPFGTSQDGLINNQTFQIFYPLQMAKSSTNSNADDFNNRESNRIYARNTKFQTMIQPRSTQVEPFQVRLMCGYFKGDDNIGTGQLTSAALKTLYPEVNEFPYTKNTGQRDFYWKYTKTYTLCPRQVYDGAFSTTITGEDDGEANRALWLPKTINYNFRYNKLFDYETDEGDALNGWVPLIVLQCLPLESGTPFTRPNILTDVDGHAGSYPGPLLHSSMITFFNDCH